MGLGLAHHVLNLVLVEAAGALDDNLLLLSVQRFLPQARNVVILLTSFFTETTVSLASTTPGLYKTKWFSI